VVPSGTGFEQQALCIANEGFVNLLKSAMSGSEWVWGGGVRRGEVIREIAVAGGKEGGSVMRIGWLARAPPVRVRGEARP
jgi:hypothetical protein